MIAILGIETAHGDSYTQLSRICMQLCDRAQLLGAIDLRIKVDAAKAHTLLYDPKRTIEQHNAEAVNRYEARVRLKRFLEEHNRKLVPVGYRIHSSFAMLRAFMRRGLVDDSQWFYDPPLSVEDMLRAWSLLFSGPKDVVERIYNTHRPFERAAFASAGDRVRMAYTVIKEIYAATRMPLPLPA